MIACVLEIWYVISYFSLSLSHISILSIYMKCEIHILMYDQILGVVLSTCLKYCVLCLYIFLNNSFFVIYL